ncbi:MAG: hypothetical protein ABJN98_09265 [Roseibium sp.]
MSTAFLLGVAQTTIGSGLGFMLGILAFHYQQQKQDDKKKDEEWKASLEALRRLNIAASANIENQLNAKSQLIDDLRPETDKMKEKVESVYASQGGDQQRLTSDLKTLAESLKHFHMSLPEVAIMPPPETKDYSMLSSDMPALAMFVFRAVSVSEEMNARIVSRNTLLQQHALEHIAGDGMTSRQLLHFSNMLVAEGLAISEHNTNALFFWKMVRKQITVYMTNKASSEPFEEYPLVEEADAQLPGDDLHPDYSALVATFER